MKKKISAVINTFNEENNLKRAMVSLKDWVDEIVVCDMYSTDNTVKVAKNLGAKVYFYKYSGFVEPARNFAISKTSHEWVLILDADEEIPNELANEIKKMLEKGINSDFVEIPRKNIIFGKWMKASMWWPDYQIRLFKKGYVEWSEKIHRPPKTSGQDLRLSPDESYAILHHNYQSISQFIDRMNRYTDIEAKQLFKGGYKFDWKDLIKKPLEEFLSRFFANKGYEDGIHGLGLSLLQAFSFLVLYTKLWEMVGFKESSINLSEIDEEKEKMGRIINYWFKQSAFSKNPFKRLLKKLQI